MRKREILFYFSKPHFVSLTAFISERFAHERIPLSISFHFTAAVSAVRKGCRGREREGNESRRNARHFARKNRPTSTDDRRLFEFLRVEAIFLEGVDGGTDHVCKLHAITRSTLLSVSLSSIKLDFEFKLEQSPLWWIFFCLRAINQFDVAKRIVTG